MIFEAITALKIANDAISTLRTSLGHINSIKDVAAPLGKLADAKEELQEKADKGDLDAFVQLKEIQDQEEAIKRMMIWEMNRPHLWEQYQTFLSTRKKMRDNEKKRIKLRKANQKKLIKDAAIIVGGIVATVGIVFLFLWVIGEFKGGA